MAPPVMSNPFPGLRHFETNEEYLFFGREGQSEEILRRLGQNRFVAVVGTSGSGKSSLVRAGLLPYLYGGFLSGTGSHWRVAMFRPGIDPIGNLARALNSPEVLGTTGEGEPDPRRALMQEVTLRRSGLGLAESVKLARLQPHENVLVIVDQFEELFRFSSAGDSEHKEDDAAAFVKLLLEAGAQKDQPVYVALTMRSDWIGDCARFRDLPEIVAAGLYLIPRMTRDQRRAAIEEPIRVAQGEISSRLVNRLLNDVGDNPDQLPILQHALMRTWEFWSTHRSDGTPMDLADYTAIGTMANALSKHADEAYEELPTEGQRSIAKRVFQALTEKGADNREGRRPTSIANLIEVTGANSTDVMAVIAGFRRRGRSFLMPPVEVPLANDTIIDISHESLIRGWERLREWVTQESESAKVYRRLAETAVLYQQKKAGLWRDPDLSNAQLWQQTQRPTSGWAKRYHQEFELAIAFLDQSRRERELEIAEEQRRRDEDLHRVRRQVAQLTAVCVIALAFLALTVYAGIKFKAERSVAVESARKAESERQEAERDKQQAEIAKEQADKSAKAELEATASAQLNYDHANQSLAIAKAKTAEEQQMAQKADAAAKAAGAAAKTAEEAAQKAKRNEDAAIENAWNNVDAFDELPDKIQSQKDMQALSTKLLQGRMDLAGSLLKDDADNSQALALEARDRVSLANLKFNQGLADQAQKVCIANESYAEQESAAGKNYFHRVLASLVLAYAAETRARMGQNKEAEADAGRALDTADQVRTEVKDTYRITILSTAFRAAARADRKLAAEEAAVRNFDAAKLLRQRAATAYLHAAETRKLAFDNPPTADALSEYITDLDGAADLQHDLNQEDDELKTRTAGVQEALASRPNPDSVASDVIFWRYLKRSDTFLEQDKLPEAQSDLDEARKWLVRLEANGHDAKFDSMVADQRSGRLMRERARQEAKQDAPQALRDLKSAQGFHLQSLATTRAIEAGDDPGGHLRSIATGDYNVGKDWELMARLDAPPIAAKDLELARKFYRDEVKDRENVVAADPTDQDAIRDLAEAHADLRDLESGAGNFKAARIEVDAQIVCLRPLASGASPLASDKSSLAAVYGNRSWYDLFLGEFDAAQADVDAALRYDGGKIWILTNKAHALLFQGKQEEAFAIYRKYANQRAYPDDPESTETFAEAILIDFAKFREDPKLNVKALADAQQAVLQFQAAASNPAQAPAQ